MGNCAEGCPADPGPLGHPGLSCAGQVGPRMGGQACLGFQAPSHHLLSQPSCLNSPLVSPSTK